MKRIKYPAAVTRSLLMLAMFGCGASTAFADSMTIPPEGIVLAQTQGMERRQDRRDDRQDNRNDRQDDRQDRRDDRQDCREQEGVGKDKRDCKQQERQDRNQNG